MGIINDGNAYPRFGRRFDEDGTVWLWAKATGGATLNTPYMMYIEEDSYIAKPLASNVHRYVVGVPDATHASGVSDWFQIGGYIAALISVSLSVAVGHGIRVASGALADAGSDYSGITGDFAVCTTASTGSTTQACILVPEVITATQEVTNGYYK